MLTSSFLHLKICDFQVQNCTFRDYRDGFFVICRQPWCSQDSSGASISGTYRLKMPSYEVKGPIGHFRASFYAETMESLVLQ